MSVLDAPFVPGAAAQRQALMDLDNPYVLGHAEVGDLYWYARHERFDTCRDVIPISRRRAADRGVERPASYQERQPLLFAHQTYKGRVQLHPRFDRPTATQGRSDDP